jgi:hypothetical protein
MRAADEWCASIFVLLYGTTTTTPKDYDYPLTRQALVGHPEYQGVVFAETVEDDKHYFGAFVDDLELARKLVALVRRNVPGSKPVLLCRNPKKVRLLEFDFTTGSVTRNERLPE